MASKIAVEMWASFIGLLVTRRYMSMMREALHPHPQEGLINQAIALYRPAMLCKGEEDLLKNGSLTGFDTDPDTVQRAIDYARALIELIVLP